MTQELIFTVLGRPVPWTRTEGDVHGTKRRITPKRQRAYQRMVANAATAALSHWRRRSCAQWDRHGAFGLECTFFTSPPLPDADNLFKGVKDALQPTVYANDRQVEEEHNYRKVDKENPRVEVRVWRKK